MINLYPLTFTPILKEKIWGGHKLISILNKDSQYQSNIGESWELSGVSNELSIVNDGPLQGLSIVELIDIYKEKLLGDNIYKRYGNSFPLLIKFIDAKEDLSIQVHPDDNVAMQRHQSPGKTEMWYVVQADDNAKLISGFTCDLSQEKYLTHLNHKSLNKVLQSLSVSIGDAFFIPAGRIHAIGAGSLIAEIQQTSDITYRIYDYDRVDDDGHTRMLHNHLALDVMDYSGLENPKIPYRLIENKPSKIVHSHYFNTNILELKGDSLRSYKSIDSFVIYICVEGEFQINSDEFLPVKVKKGETLLLPAIFKNILLRTEGFANVLEVYIDEKFNCF